jgi:hypothetical protein
MLIFAEGPQASPPGMSALVEHLRRPGLVSESPLGAKKPPPKENFASEALVEHRTQDEDGDQ